jgi:hypothetical protein
MEMLYSAVMDWVKILVPFVLGIVFGIIVKRYENNWMRPRIKRLRRLMIALNFSDYLCCFGIKVEKRGLGLS